MKFLERISKRRNVVDAITRKDNDSAVQVRDVKEYFLHEQEVSKNREIEIRYLEGQIARFEEIEDEKRALQIELETIQYRLEVREEKIDKLKRDIENLKRKLKFAKDEIRDLKIAKVKKDISGKKKVKKEIGSKKKCAK